MDYFIVELIDTKKVAIPLNQVQEVININYSDISPIPGVNSSLLGVTNHRGNFLWILELSHLLFNQYLPNFTSNTILLTKIKHHNLLGLVVQKLGEIKTFSLPDKSITDNLNLNYYQGLISDGENIPILDLINLQKTLNGSS